MNCGSYSKNKCWNYLGSKDKDGYGLLKAQQVTLRAHRFSFYIHNGFVDCDKFVCHSCDNPSCVNPNHLWQGSNSENQKDSVKKGRHHEAIKTHCKHGHEYTKENTRYQILHNRKKRQCAECNRTKMRIRYQKENSR